MGASASVSARRRLIVVRPVEPDDPERLAFEQMHPEGELPGAPGGEVEHALALAEVRNRHAQLGGLLP